MQIAPHDFHVMPPVNLAIDGLWQCLCPSFAAYSLAPALILRPVSSLVSSPCLKPVPSSVHRSRIAQRTLISTNIHPLKKQRPHVSTHKYNRIRQLHDDHQELKETLADPLLRKLAKSDVYEELRRASIRGNYLRVQEITEILVTERNEAPNARIYLALILANTSPQHGSLAGVKRLLEEMVEEGIVPDSATYHAVLKVLAIHPDYILRNKILEDLRQRWFTLTNDGWHDVTVGLVRDRQIEIALDKLEQMQQEGMKIRPWLHDIMVYTLCDAEEFDEVLKIMRYRVSNVELSISGTLWYYILDTASRAFHYEATLYAWHKRVETDYLNPPSGLCINILNTAARYGDFRLATDVFRILGKRTNTLQLYHYEALLESYINASDLKTALTILTVMASSSMLPEESTTRPIYLYLRQAPSRPAEALAILRDLRKAQRTIPAPAINCIIEASIHLDDLASAIETYKTLHTLCTSGPTTATFNALFRGCNKSSRKDLAMFLASEMLALDVPPNALTYDRLILVCLDATGEDDYEDAFKYFKEMKALGWWPRNGTLVAMVRRCCEQGDDRAWELVGEMEGMGIDIVAVERWMEKNWKGDEDARTMRGMEKRDEG